MNRLAAVLAAALMFLAPALAQDPPAPSQTHLTQFLAAIDFGSDVKASLREALPPDAQKDPAVQALLKLPDARYVAAAASVLQKSVAPEQARQMAQFYQSATMRDIYRQQKANANAALPVNITPAQKAEFDAFMAGDGGRAVMKVLERMAEPDFLEQLLGSLEKEL